MCGIVGCKLKRPLSSDDINLMRVMRDQMSHRGPDGAGEFILNNEGFYLGHRRLSIIDPEPRSAQPYVDDDMVITFNGEIYNYIELREELGSHASFETTGDTEVLLKSWRQWGAKCLDKLDGMYAFAIRDEAGLHLVTDVFGEKPLYIYENEDGIYFSSEAAPLIKHCHLEWKPSQNDINDFINLGYVRPPHTGYEGLENVAPATHITINPNGKRITRSYWSSGEPTLGHGTIRPFEESQIDDIRDLLCASLEKRLRSDVPIGLFLSGGVDSALVAALAIKELGANLQSYTVSFKGVVDESGHASKIANHLDMSHTIIPSSNNSSSQDGLGRLIDLYGGVPNDNMTGFSVEEMCWSAKKHLTVALSGLGGDELFFGYNKHEFFYRSRMLYSVAPYLQTVLPLLNALPFSKIKTAVSMLRGEMGDQYLRQKNGVAQDSIIKMERGKLDDFWNDIRVPFYVQTRNMDMHYSMSQSHIPAIDRGSMRQSVEVRTPFLNRKLQSYVWQLDQRALIHFGQKNMLKSLLKRYMPLDLLVPQKQGFVYPLRGHFDNDKSQFSMPPWVEKSDVILNNAKEGVPEYERLALRLCLLSRLKSG